MILDTLANGHLYSPVHPRFAKAFEYLRSTNLASLSAGRQAIDGDDVFALVNLYDTKAVADSKWEAHRKYIDIQYMVSGTERIGVAPLADLEVTKTYDDKDDYLLLAGKGTMLQMRAGLFAVFYPHDAHMPNVSPAETPVKVRKVVVKVRV